MRFRHLAPICLFAVASLLRAAEPTVPVTPSSDLPPDSNVRWGRLDNGIRYAILPNHEPRGRASLRLGIGAGALNETEAQRGVAHFLEHMSFNGSTHFAPGTMVEFFQRLGMAFGADTNAFTSFDRTVYMLELSDTTPERFKESFTYFSDVAGGLLLLPAEIDKERGVIMSEKIARDSVSFRQFEARFDYLLAGTKFPARMPIGLDSVIKGAPREQFVDFYNTWYRPDLMCVAVVGDVDPDVVEPILREIMGGVAPRAPEQPAPDRGSVQDVHGIEARLHTDMEAPSVQIAIEAITPYSYEPDTAANRQKYLPRNVAMSILNRRLSELAKKEGAPFMGGSFYASEQFDTFRDVGVGMACKPENWSDALTVADQELRRALQYGFQPAELKEVVASMKNGFEQSVLTASTRQSAGLALPLVSSMIDKNVFTHPVTDRDLFVPALEKLTVDDCLAALRQAWPEGQGLRIWVTGNLQLDDAEKTILAAYEKSRTTKVEAPAKIEEAEFGYTDFGTPGTVVRSEKIDDLGVTLIRFANGVRLNLKPTDFEAGRIRVSVRVGGGQLTAPDDLPGLGFYTNSTFMAGGLGKHSSDDLRRVLAGKTVGTGFGAGSDAFNFQGTTNKDDLDLQFRLMCAYLTDPGFRPEAVRQFEKSVEVFYKQLSTTVEGPLQKEVPRLLANGDPRFGLPSHDEAVARTSDEVRAWLKPEFEHGAIEIAVVGDFDPEAVIAAVAKTYGALPERTAKPAYDAQRKAEFPPEPIAKVFNTETEIPKAIVQLFWPATDSRDVHLARRLGLLTRVLNDRLRLKIREEMGGTYSPTAGANLSDTYFGYGYLTASAVADPEQARKVADAMREVAAGLHDGEVTEDELTRSKEPVLTSIRQSARTNGYWLGNVLSDAQEYPEKLEWSRTRLSDTESIAAAELTALAHQYLDPAKVDEFISRQAPPAAKSE